MIYLNASTPNVAYSHALRTCTQSFANLRAVNHHEAIDFINGTLSTSGENINLDNAHIFAPFPAFRTFFTKKIPSRVTSPTPTPADDKEEN